jgi:hypothetical protein
MPANLAGPRRLAAARADRATGRPAVTGPPPAALSLPHWRVALEAIWQARLLQVTELSLAFHDAEAAASAGGPGSSGIPESARRGLRELMGRAVAARRALADVDEALARLEAGRFGRCEQCAAAIPEATLARAPQTRYCPACDCVPAADLR